MAGIPKTTRNKKPEPCKNCGEDVWNPYTGSCDECHAKVYAEFVKAMGWEDDSS
jgi:hypothetical protein